MYVDTRFRTHSFAIQSGPQAVVCETLCEVVSLDGL